MIKLTDYRKINHLVDRIRIEKVYPLSILEGIQTGEIFVENAAGKGTDGLLPLKW